LVHCPDTQSLRLDVETNRSTLISRAPVVIDHGPRRPRQNHSAWT
jgi:hypothetical protein